MKAARGFVRAHGPSKAVVEQVGRAGARVVLVGADGAMGDVLVADVAAAEALIEKVAGLEAATWDAETVNATRIGAAHRRKMAGARLLS
jgi:phosphosulfolactate phosphohydrolase-like enzyme